MGEMSDEEIAEAGLSHVHAALPCPDGWTEDEVWGWLAQGLELPAEGPGTTWVNFYLDPEGGCELCDAGHVPENSWLALEEFLDGPNEARVRRLIAARLDELDDAAPAGG